MNKALIVGPAWVGDMVMAQSLFKVLKQQDPNRAVDVLAPDWSRPLLERMPEVRRAIPLSVPHGVLNLKLRYQLAQTLREEDYQEAFVLPNSWKSALIPCWAKIPKRIGYRGEMRFGLLNDLRILDKAALPRMVERFVALAYDKESDPPKASDTPIPCLRTEEKSVNEALAKFQMEKHAIGIEKHDTEKPMKRILALCPGAEFGASKRWPEQHFAAVANQKLDEGVEVWIFGSKNDMAVSEEIQKNTEHRCVDFTGRTSLGEAIDLLSLSTAVISNDSGLMHIAAALNKPLVAVYGSTDPGFTPPLNHEARIARLNIECSPCFKRVCPLEHNRCMKDLTPDRVLDTLNALEG